MAESPRFKTQNEIKTIIKHSTNTLNNRNVCMKIFSENALYSTIGEFLSFSMITQDHIQQESHKKKLGWSIQKQSIILPELARSDFFFFFFFFFYKILWMTKDFVKKFV